MDGLFLAAGVRGISPPGISAGGGLAVRTHPAQVSALCRSAVSTNASGISVEAKEKRWKRNDEITLEGEEEDDEEEEEEEPKLHPELTRSKKKRGNWVLKILHVRSLWTEKGKANVSEGILEKIDEQGASDQDRWACCDEDESDGCSVDDVEVDRDSFCRLLRRVSLMEANLYSQMSYLCNLAYHIPKIKPGDFLKHNGLRLVTSSLKKKALSANAAEKEPTSAHVQGIEKEAKETEEAEESQRQRKQGYRISASAAYQIAAAAASFLQSQSKSILPSKIIEKELNKKTEIMKAEVASLVATTNSVTAVVAAKEEMKQAVAEDLNSSRSSPCEWFICDDESGGTRFFVIQGSESLASWQANLLFEPVRFEGLDVLVHRGIYEAAKGIYEQMLPEVQAHLKSRGGSATLRFTGHSLGGSLSLLVNLMLLIRGEAPLSSLLPVVTFGSPSIMCGGDYLLLKLGLPRSHVQAIMMHRDIVPRAFSCNYPDHVAELLKAVNGNFRNHPCLNNQKLLYAPIGELLILQPEEKLSPHHHLLPSASGLYLFVHPLSDSDKHTKEVQAAQAVFLNSPHPLEILSDPSAYGSEGSIYRDHDMNSYLQSIRNVISREVKQIRKAKREHRRQAWWPLIAPHGVYIGDPVEQQWPKSSNVRQGQLRFLRAFTIGRESFGRFGRLIASQHIHMLVVLLFPARLLLIGWSIRFHCTVNTTFLR